LVPDSELPKAAHSECDRLGVGDAGHPPAFAGKNDILSSQYKERNIHDLSVTTVNENDSCLSPSFV